MNYFPKIIMSFLFMIMSTHATRFCVIIPTYHNRDYCIENIQTLLNQSHTDWEAHIIIDGIDGDDDGTEALLSQFIKDNYLEEKVIIHKPYERRLALHNIYTTVQMIKDPETVIVLYDGDDYFLSPYALERIAREYNNPQTWMTYGQYVNIPRGDRGNCRKFDDNVMKYNTFRRHPWVASHVRTYKTWLFKSVPLRDLLHEGRFFPVAWDVAFLPMLEMSSKGHIVFIDEPLYAYRHHENNDYCRNWPLMVQLERVIRNKKPYKPLKQSRASKFRQLEHSKADIIIFSKDRPLQLYALLESIYKHTQHYASCTIIYHAVDEQFEQAYRKVASQFPFAHFMRQSSNPRADFKQLTLHALKEARTPYVVFAVDDIIVKDSINFRDAIKRLEETQAYAVFMRVGHNTTYCYSCNIDQGLPPLLAVDDTMYAWEFNRGKADWNYPNNVDMTLYRIKDIKKTISNLCFSAPNNFEAQWSGQTRTLLNKIGLCYRLSKIVNIPVNVVQQEYANRNMRAFTPQELLAKFNEGLKIDISAYWQTANNAAHTEYPLHFISRDE